MEPVQYLRALRQWRFVILGLAIVGILAAVLMPTPGQKYAATHTLVRDTTEPDTVSLARGAFLVTSADVLNRVADATGTTPDAVARGC